jgi:hypothetical protein
MSEMALIEVADAADDIRTFLPGIKALEYDLRAKLRGQRNAMTALIATTESDTARCLAWLVVEYVSATLYAPVGLARLSELRRFCHRLALTAMQAEEIDQ